MTDSREAQWNRTWLWDSLAVLGIALALGAVYSWQIVESPLWMFSVHPGTDMHVYVGQALGIADGSWPDAAPFYRAPLYPYFLRLLLPLTFYGCCMAQTLLYGSAAVMVMAGARLLAGRLAGWVAAALLLTYGGAFFFVAVLHSTILELFLSATCILLLIMWQRRGAWAIVVGTGVAYGLLCLVRPNYFACAPFLGLGFLLAAPDSARRKRVLLQGIVTATVAFLVILPAIVHSNRYSEKPVIMTTNGAKTFWIGNSENSPVFGFTDASKSKRLPVISTRFWAQQAKKAFGYWWSGEAPQNVNFYLFRDACPVLWLQIVPFGMLGALFLVSAWFTRDDWRRLWPCHAMFWPYYLSIVAFFIIGRFRIPALPPMLILGAVGVCRLISRRRQQQVAAGVFAVLTLISMPWARTVTVSDLYSCGMLSMIANQPGRAEPFFRQAASRKPNWDNQIQHAIALTAIGRHSDAVDVVGKLTRQFPRNHNLAETLAASLERAGKKIDAENLRQAYAARYPGKPGNDLIYQGLMYFQQERQRYNSSLPLRRLAQQTK